MGGVEYHFSKNFVLKTLFVVLKTRTEHSRVNSRRNVSSRIYVISN